MKTTDTKQRQNIFLDHEGLLPGPLALIFQRGKIRRIAREEGYKIMEAEAAAVNRTESAVTR